MAVVGWYIGWWSLRRKSPAAGVEAGAGGIRAGPTIYLTSTGFVTETQWVRFIQTILTRRGVLDAADSGEDAKREALVEKYASDIQKLKVTFINDAGFHRDVKMMAGGRKEDPE